MEKALIRFFLQYLLSHYFESKADMARQLDVNSRTIQRAFELLDCDQAKGGSIVVDKALWFCAQRQFSLDDMFHSYYSAQNEQGQGLMDTLREEEAHRPAYTMLTLPKPEGLNDTGEQAYEHALAFTQKASLYLCPRCDHWCDPWNGANKALKQSCMIAHVAKTLIKDIQSIHAQE